ncbi:glucose dehydrogenase [FAD, quinone] [Folsomia candida]|uniref:glucose dehydrogenase [FAD, quinone] n=1 Tax=Folsomia candida TaxID=158441 RepID=UPI001604DD95|nr:glucose dehydrogenase [FAD, quinone] [Folsomia candida]
MDPSNSILQFLNTIPIPMVVLANLKIIVAGITTFLALLNHGFDSVMDPIPLFSPSTNYDFIIVGGGSAGAVVANRLSTNPNFKVLLLEAGGNPTVLNSIPAMAMSNMRNPYTDWMTRSEPLNTSCLACKDNLITISRGKMLGGSSSLNVMVYMRGNPNDFDNWANLTGDASWSYENVLPYFKKSEDYTGNYPDPKYHGTGGPLSVTAQPDDPLTRDWMSAAREMGFSNSDPNAYQTSTFVPIDHTMKDGRRWSTYNAFIQPVLHRRNFKVIRYAHVTKVNFDSTKRAVGVSYIKNGRTFTATASKEVVLSAGGIGSPHVLMLSGIGHSDHLKSFGIRTISNLAVGDNLQDHLLSLAGPFILNDTVANRDISTYKREHINFTSSSLPITIQPYSLQYVNEFVGRDAHIVGFNLGLPKSRGTIRLRSADPLEQPVVDLNYFSHPYDMKEMIRGLKLLIKLYEETKTFRKYNATLMPKHYPGCESHIFRSDEYYECLLRHCTSTTWHQSCSAKMGHADDPSAVLDSRLRVRGVKGLRVADASIMPRITNANLNAPVIMIGEKAASMILDDWK